jgi:hypothetical protein
LTTSVPALACTMALIFKIVAGPSPFNAKGAMVA